MQYVRFIALFVAIFALLMTSSDGVLSRFGLEHNPLIAGLVAVVIAGLIHDFKHIFLAVVLLLVVGANLPPDTAAEMGFDRDYAIAVLIAALITPWVMRHLDE